MTSKHTPGPWDAGERDRGVITVFARGLNVSPAVAHIHTGTTDYPEADARLIAAGPELLELIREKHDTTLCGCRVNFPGECFYCRAGALLAKIDGEGA